MLSKADSALGPEEDRIRGIVLGWFVDSGMTQQMVSAKVGLAQTTVSSFLRGRTFGTVDNLKAYCGCFGYHLADLFRDAVGPVDTDVVMRRYRVLSPQAQRAILTLMDSAAPSAKRIKKGKSAGRAAKRPNRHA